jgi:hypothetical protein
VNSERGLWNITDWAGHLREKLPAPTRAESFSNPGARDRNRTDDLILTMDALLPAELRGRAPCAGPLKMVAGAGFEPATSGL